MLREGFNDPKTSFVIDLQRSNAASVCQKAGRSMRAGGEKVAYMIGFEKYDAHLFLGETTHLW